MKKYELIEEYILGKIKNGELKHKDKLESVDELCVRFDVSHITVQKALSELAAKGKVTRVKGAGTFVCCEPEPSKRKSISMILPVVDDYPNSSILNIAGGAKKRAEELGYTMLPELCSVSSESFCQAVESAILKGAGAIAMYVIDMEVAIEAIKKYKIPMALIDLFDDRAPCSGVTVNNTDGEFLVVDHLIKRGHKRIGYVTAGLTRSTERMRYDGYVAAMKMAGYEKFIHTYSFEETGLSEIVRDVKDGKLTAIAAVNDQAAMTILQFLLMSGISVPEQCSIVGFDDHDCVKFSTVPLTTVKQNFADIGASAIDLLDEQLRGSEYSCRKIFSPVKLIERESVLTIKE